MGVSRNGLVKIMENPYENPWMIQAGNLHLSTPRNWIGVKQPSIHMLEVPPGKKQDLWRIPEQTPPSLKGLS